MKSHRKPTTRRQERELNAVSSHNLLRIHAATKTGEQMENFLNIYGKYKNHCIELAYWLF